MTAEYPHITANTEVAPLEIDGDVSALYIRVNEGLAYEPEPEPEQPATVRLSEIPRLGLFSPVSSPETTWQVRVHTEYGVLTRLHNVPGLGIINRDPDEQVIPLD